MSESNGCQKKNPYSNNHSEAYDPRKDGMIREMFNSGNWFQFPKQFLCIMSDTEAILLSYLISHARGCRAAERHDHWFYCKKSRILRDLFIPLRKQQRLFASLISRGFIATKWQGQPAKRWIKIRSKKLYLAVEKVYEMANLPDEEILKAIRLLKSPKTGKDDFQGS